MNDPQLEGSVPAGAQPANEPPLQQPIAQPPPPAARQTPIPSPAPPTAESFAQATVLPSIEQPQQQAYIHDQSHPHQHPHPHSQAQIQIQAQSQSRDGHVSVIDLHQHPEYAPASTDGYRGGHEPQYNGAMLYQQPNLMYAPAPANNNHNASTTPPQYVPQLAIARHKKVGAEYPSLYKSEADKEQDIKRRTKTGCLTCRKRRIKCDEAHPACRNCEKSKRTCMGYDPVFKHPVQAPSNIQPAPTPSHQHYVPTHIAYHQSSQGYGNPNHTHDSPNNAHSQPYYSPGVIQPAPITTQVSVPLDPNMASRYPGQMIPGKTKMDDLIDQGGQATPVTAAITSQLSDNKTIDEIKHLYMSIYATGLENFLESKWFDNRGLQALLHDVPTLEKFVILLERFKLTQDVSDAQVMAFTCSVEARMCWSLALLVRKAAAEQQPGAPASADDAVEIEKRLAVFENLVTGAVVPNRLTRPDPAIHEAHRIRELEFWFQLGHFLSLVDDGSPNFTAAMDNAMAAMRGLLDGRENRDVLYSLVVVRALKPRVAEYTDQDKPVHLDETDARSKLAVAKKFVVDEGLGAGTTNVIRRFCELAARSWVTVVPSLASPA